MSQAFFDRRQAGDRRLYCRVGQVHDCRKGEDRRAAGPGPPAVQGRVRRDLRTESEGGGIRSNVSLSPDPGATTDTRKTPCRQAGQSLGREAGQSLVESTFVLLVFFVLLFGVIDCGQVLVAHQSLVERVRGAVRWGVVRPYDGTGDQIANLVLYNQSEEPAAATDGYLGLSRDNVIVRYRPATAERPDDETLSVAIVNYRYHFMSPWVGKALVNARPVLMSAPMAYRTAASAAAPASASRP